MWKRWSYRLCLQAFKLIPDPDRKRLEVEGKSFQQQSSNEVKRESRIDCKDFNANSQNSQKYQLVGNSNEVNILVNGHKCTALLDTGSMITTVCEEFYERVLKKDCEIQSLDTIITIQTHGRSYYRGRRGSCLVCFCPDHRYTPQKTAGQGHFGHFGHFLLLRLV